MKTIEKVIRANEICSGSAYCIKCPYFKYDDCNARKDKDSLFYLKQYKLAMENCADALAEKYPSENVPLTWEELKEMVGKPIWVEDQVDDEVKHNRWYVIEGFDGERCIQLNDLYFSRDYYGNIEDGWQAYRKEKRTP